MRSIQEFEAMIPQVTLADRVAMRDQLDLSIEESLSVSNAAMEYANVALLERRLDAYEAGDWRGSPWEEVEARIRQKTAL